MITVTINTVDRTNEIKKFSVQLEQSLSKQPSSVRFLVEGVHTQPALGATVVLTEDGVDLFNGTIVEKHASANGAVLVGYEYVCLDGYFTLDSKLISKAYKDTTVGAVVADLVTLSGSTITVDVPETTPAIKTARFNYEQPSRCIQKLANLVGWDWYIDASNVLHFFAPDETPAPITITDDNGTVVSNSLSFDSNITELKNLVWVRGGEYLDPIAAADAVDVYAADGSQQAFPLVYRYSDVEVTLDGVAQTVGADFLNDAADYDCLYNYQEKLVRFPDGTLTGGEVVRVFGNAHVPLIVQAVDTDSVTTYGLREGVQIDKSINSIEEAEILANSLLEKWRLGSLEGSFRTKEKGLRVGQSITINSTRFGINRTYKINRLRGAVRHHGEFEYTVEFLTSGQTTLTDMLIDLIGKDNRNIEISPDEVIQRFRQVVDTFGVDDEIVEMIQTSPPYYYGNEWDYKVKITIDHTKVAGADVITDFPVYVDLSTLPDAFFENVNTDGSDIRVFESDNATELPFELVAIDTMAKTGELWFKGDVDGTNNTEFYIWYGNANAVAYARDAAYGSDNVWGTTVKYVGHFQGSADDSTVEANDGVVTGAVQVDGSIGMAYQYDGVDDEIEILPATFSGMAAIVKRTDEDFKRIVSFAEDVAVGTKEKVYIDGVEANYYEDWKNESIVAASVSATEDSRDSAGAYLNQTLLGSGTSLTMKDYTPTERTKITRLGVYITDKGTGNMEVNIIRKSDGRTFTQSNTGTNGEGLNVNLPASGWKYFTANCILEAGVEYSLRVYNSNGTAKIKSQFTNNILFASYVLQKGIPDATFTVVAGGRTLTLAAQDALNGVLHGSILNLDTGTYSLPNINMQSATEENALMRTLVYTSKTWNGSAMDYYNYLMRHGSGVYDIKLDGTASEIVVRIDTILPAHKVKVTGINISNSTRTYSVDYSLNGVDWVNLGRNIAISNFQAIFNAERNNVVYVKYYKHATDNAGGTNYMSGGFSIQANLDLSGIPLANARLGKLGGAFFAGILDEVKLGIPQTVEYVTTDFNNQDSPATFYAVGTQEDVITNMGKYNFATYT